MNKYPVTHDNGRDVIGYVYGDSYRQALDVACKVTEARVGYPEIKSYRVLKGVPLPNTGNKRHLS